MMGMAESSSASSNSGDDKSTSGEGLKSLRRASTSSEPESSVSDTDGVTMADGGAWVALGSGSAGRGQVVKKKYVRRG